MKKALHLTALALVLVMALASCNGGIESPGNSGSGGSAGQDSSPFVGTWRSTEKQMFQKTMGSDIIFDYVYMKADEDSVIFYVPAFGSTADLPYSWSEKSMTFTVTEDGSEFTASVFSTGNNYTFTWGGKVSVMEGMTGVPQMAPNSDVEIEPNMPGNGGGSGGDPEQPSEPVDPDGYLTIEKDGVYYSVTACDPLATDVVIPSGVSVISANAFEGCTNLVTVEIPSSVRWIEDNAFDGCTDLTRVSFEDGSRLSSIGREAFSGCTSLKEIEIPANVTDIGISAFMNCSNLETVLFEEGSMLDDFGNMAFWGCTSLTEITLPASVTDLGSNTFSGCSSLARVTFESGIQIKEIGYNVFENCTSLDSITIPEGVTSISGCFYGCESLSEIELPDSLERIGGATFTHTALVSIEVPANVSYLERQAFDGCGKLENITFQEGSKIETIHPWTFKGCTSLRRIEIPANVVELENYAFGDCTNLAEVTFAEGSKLETMGNSIFSNTKITEITIPAGLTSYGYSIFPNTLASIRIPESLKAKIESDPNGMSIPDGCKITWY